MIETFVREYKTMAAAQQDMNALGKSGYEVVSVSEKQQKVGCMRFALLGFFALIWKPKPHVLVTYRRVALPPTAK